MGTFAGHAIPGTLFIITSVWWLCNVTTRFNKDKWTGLKYKATASYPGTLCSRKMPVEGFVKIIFSIFGCLCEFIWALKTNGIVLNGNLQHILMYSMFGISGTVDVVMFYKENILPSKSDYVMMVLAFSNEFILFKYHLGGRSEVDVLLHSLLIITIGLSVASFCFEAYFQRSPVLGIIKAYSCLVQGSWFWRVGWYLYGPDSHLYGPGWHSTTPHQDKKSSILISFSVYLTLNAVLVLIMFMFITLFQQLLGKYGRTHAYSRLNQGNHKGGNIEELEQ